MNTLENNLNEKIEYLKVMKKKYYDLNQITNYKFIKTHMQIRSELSSLEELKRLDKEINKWDDCYNWDANGELPNN